MRVSEFLVLWAPVALTGGVACGAELPQRPQGAAPVYEPWALPSWSGNSGPHQPAGGDALDALLEGGEPPTLPAPTVSPGIASSTDPSIEPSIDSSNEAPTAP